MIDFLKRAFGGRAGRQPAAGPGPGPESGGTSGPGPAPDSAAGPRRGLHCMLRQPDKARRWRPGSLLTGGTPLVWTPAMGRGRPRPLPSDLHRTAAVRAPTTREGMSIHPGSRIVECDSSEGPLQIAVMPSDVRALLAALPGPDPEPAPGPDPGTSPHDGPDPGPGQAGS